MKLLITVICFTATLWVLQAAPVPRNWEGEEWNRLAEIIGEIQSLVRSKLEEIIGVAKSENQEIGNDMETVLEQYLEQARVVMGESQQAIEDKVLTCESAKANFQRLESILQEARVAIQDRLEQLSQSTQEQISQLFAGAFDQAMAKVQEVYSLGECPSFKH